MFVIARFKGSIAGSALTVLKGSVYYGQILIGSQITGPNVPLNTLVVSASDPPPHDTTGNTYFKLSQSVSPGVNAELMIAEAGGILESHTTVFTTVLIVPLLATPSQTLTVELNDQNTNINVYQRSTGLYVDVGINNSLLIGGVLALDRNRIVRDTYLGFVGDLAFFDNQGIQDPDWTGLNSRYYLGYFSTA